MAKSKGFDPGTLGRAEVVLVNGGEVALALGYTPGETPQIVAKALGKDTPSMLWAAQELGLPLIETHELERALVRGLIPGNEIPPELYRVVAQSIALSQRPSPQRIRLMRPNGKAGQSLAQRLSKTVEQIFDELEVAKVRVRVAGDIQIEPLRQLVELHRHRLQVETGIPFGQFGVESSTRLQPLHFEIELAGAVERRGVLSNGSDFGDLLKALYDSIFSQGWRLLGFREVEAMLSELSKRQRSLHNALFPERLNLGVLRQILRNLLKEGLSIAHLETILEALTECLPGMYDPDALTEFVRARFARELSRKFQDEKGVLHALLVEPAVESQILQQLRESSSALWLELDLDSSIRLLRSTAKGVDKARVGGYPVVVLCSPRPRRYLRRLLEPSFPHLPVLSFAEIAPLTEVQTVGMVSLS